MSVAEIAQSLVEMCRAGKFEEAYGALFAPDARSVEGTGDVSVGMEAIGAKSAQWGAENDVKAATVEGPYVGGDQFAVVFRLEVARKATGEQLKIDEVGVYTVKDGKIVEERFLYGA